MNKYCRVLFTMLACFTVCGTQAAIMSFADWQQQGPIANGEWQLSQDAYSVIQTNHSNPSYFISKQSYLDVHVTGTFGVDNNSDDDFIGLVFGFNGFDDYYLFDWKRLTQNYNNRTAHEGFRLSKIEDGITTNLWDHSGLGIQPLVSHSGRGLGWRDNIEYQLSLMYTKERIKLTIDGGEFDAFTVFDQTNLNNQGGALGFYSYSQGAAFFRQFESRSCVGACETVAVTAPPMWSFALPLILIGVISYRRRHLH